MRERKMQHKIARMENTGEKNAVPICMAGEGRDGKCEKGKCEIITSAEINNCT